MAKYGKNEWGPFGDIEMFWKKKQKLRIFNKVTVPKNVKGGPFVFFNIPSVVKLKWCLKIDVVSELRV